MAGVTEPPHGAAPPPRAYEAARLRSASSADASRLAELVRLARPEAPEAAETTLDWLESGGALVLEDERGHLLSALRWRETEDGWQVDRVATLPQARGLGFGRWLMTKVEALAIRANIPRLTLTLASDDLLPYYRRLGYRPAEDEDDVAPHRLSKRVGGTWQTRAPEEGA